MPLCAAAPSGHSTGHRQKRGDCEDSADRLEERPFAAAAKQECQPAFAAKPAAFRMAGGSPLKRFMVPSRIKVEQRDH
jgi:hypothetical protein